MRAVIRVLVRVLLSVTVALVLACEREPDELQFVVGKVVSAEGEPLPGHAVRFERNGVFTCNVASRSVLSSGVDAGTFVEAATFTSNEHGDFLFEVTHRETLADTGDFPGAPACFRVIVEDEGGTSTSSFQFGSVDVELPDMPARRQPPSAKWVSEAIELDSSERIALAGYETSSIQWTVSSGDDTAWVQSDDGGVQRLDARIVEDFPGLNVLHEAHALLSPTSVPISFQTHYGSDFASYSSRVSLPQGQEVPFSRGAACEPAHFPDGSACLLTDGRLEPVSWLVPTPMDGGAVSPPPEALTIDLGAPQPVHTLIVHGLDFERPVDDLFAEVSVDGETWTRAATLGSFTLPTDSKGWDQYNLDQLRVDGVYLSVPLETSGPQRFIRLRGQHGVPPWDTSGIQPGPLHFYVAKEISVF